MARKHSLVVGPGDPRSLPAWLQERIGLDEPTALSWLARGTVRVGGRPAGASDRVNPGDRVVAHEPPPAVIGDFEIVLSDDDLLVVDKPAGLLVQASPTETLALEGLIRAAFPEARLLHRIDRDASGLVVFTRRPSAHAFMQEELLARRLHRQYRALVGGTLDGPRAIRLRIAPDPGHPSRRRALPEAGPAGEEACTFVTKAVPRGGQAGPLTLVEAALDTGRTHQIRVHLSAIGHPIVGDRLYGGAAAERLHLHAERLAFRHPSTGALVEVVSRQSSGFGF